MSIENFDINRLPAEQWAKEINKFTQNIKYSAVMNGDEESNGRILKNMDDRITFVANQILHKFDVRYGHIKYSDSHSLNATKSLMIYNPFSFVWVPYSSVADAMTSALNKNLSADSHVEALADAIAFSLGSPRPSVTVPKDYTGTRYQLFLNGIYDLTDDVFFDFKDDLTEDSELYINKKEKRKMANMGFTEKHIHNILFDMNPDEPVFYDALEPGHEEGEDWDFRTWLLKLNGNDKEKRDWLLYVMGLCILPNVNIGANIILRGDSGSGKSTIGTLISKMYTGGDSGIGLEYDSSAIGLISNEHTADTLNEDFPFRGTLTPKLNFIHLSEMNGTRMSALAGTLYDKFADNDLDAKKLHAQSFKLSPSPTLFMEGTKWANFDTVKNGVERRTLPVALNPTPDLKYYTSIEHEKKDLFEHEKILTWLVRHCYKAIRKFRDKNRLHSIHLNLMRDDLPEFVKEWRQEMMSGGDEITTFYDDLLSDALIVEKPISIGMLHDLYNENCDKRGVNRMYRKNRHNFQESIEAKFESKGYIVNYYNRKFKEPNIKNIGLNLDVISHSIPLPTSLTPLLYTEEGYGRYYNLDWFELEKANNID